MFDETYGATVDAVTRFLDRSPIACVDAERKNAVSAGLWRNSTREGRFEGHQRHILGIALRGDADQELIVDGRCVWRGSVLGTIVVHQVGQTADWCFKGTFEMIHVYLDSDRVAWNSASPVLDRPFRDPVMFQLAKAAAMGLRDDVNNRYIQPLLESLQQYLVDHYFDPCANTVEGASGGLTTRVQREIQAFIRDNISSSICAEDLARMAGLSNGHFNRAFKDSFGISPKQYVIEQRVHRGADLLTNTDMDVRSISEQTGFASASHFGSHFKNRIGVSPIQYRRMN